MNHDRPRATVVGAGPVGLLSAEQLLRAGFDVTVVHTDTTTEPSPTFAGPAAAGLIEPVATAPADERLVAGLLGDSLAYWLATTADPSMGADTVDVHFTPAAAGPPQWVTTVMGGVRGADGIYVYRSVVVTTRTWLTEQHRRLRQRAVTIRPEHVEDLNDIVDTDLIVNASGPGAWHLGDDEMYGRRGPLVWVRRVEGLDHVRFDDSTFTYGIPQRERVALGGAADRYDGDPYSWPRQLTDDEADDLLERARALFPDAAWNDAEVLSATVNYRPCRTRIRLELDRDARVPVVHATGLGGSGWTLAPALATQVAALASEAIHGATERTAQIRPA